MASAKFTADCFNPRPPLPGGDARDDAILLIEQDVSIHAPRCREAMPENAVTTGPESLFQSTPPVAGRRCRCRPAPKGR